MATPFFNYPNFGTLDAILFDAYKRAQIDPIPVDEESLRSARASAAYEMAQMPGSCTKLWLKKKQILPLIVGQPSYPLYAFTVNAQDLVLTNPYFEPNTGTAASNVPVEPGTSPGNCFEPLPNSGCRQTEPNGAISYYYGPTNLKYICYIFVTSLIDSIYSLAFEYTLSDPAENIWVTAYESPPLRFLPNQPQGFVIEEAVSAVGWRIRETQNATLAISQIRLARPPSATTGTEEGDIALGTYSQSKYIRTPYKAQIGRPTTYYLDLLRIPTLNFWPAPNGQYTHALYVQSRLPSVPERLSDPVDLLPTFYDAFIWGVAARLALKENKPCFADLENQRQQAYVRAGLSNVQPVAFDTSGRAGV